MTGPPKRRWWLGGAAAVILALLFLFVDEPLAQAMAGVRTPWLTTTANLISELRGVVFFGAASLLTWVAGLALRRRRLRDAGAIMLLSVAASAAVVSVIKPVVARAGPVHGVQESRPDESWLERRWGRFPSGHTAAAVAAAQGLASVYPATAFAGWAASALVAGERLYRQSHFASDCFAGGWIGWAAAQWIARALRRRWGARDAEGDDHGEHGWTVPREGC